MPAGPRAHRAQSDKPAWERALQRLAATPPAPRLFMRAITRIDRKLMPLTRGRLGTLVGQPTLIVHACGARTGESRPTPLIYTKRGDDLVVVASAGGAARHPAWYRNLMAHPDVDVEVGGRRRPYHASEAQGPEREELWRLALDNYSGYDDYQRRAGRRIPVVVLSPR